MLQRIAPKSIAVPGLVAVVAVCLALFAWLLLGGASAPTPQPVPTAMPTLAPATFTAQPDTPTPSPTETPLPAKSLGTWPDGSDLVLPDGLSAGVSTQLPGITAEAAEPVPPGASETALTTLTAVTGGAPVVTTTAIQKATSDPVNAPGPLSTALARALGNGGSQLVPTRTPAPQNTPTPVLPTATPKPDGTPILPSGAKYGERYPKVPGRVVRIAAPSIKLDTKVYEVYGVNGTWEVAEYAAGHHYNAKNPGEGGNIVLSGHNNWRGEVFRYLENLKPGDEVRLWTLEGKEYVYKVRSISKLKDVGVSYAQRLKNAEVMKDTPKEQLTLITCWPYTTFTHRLVVVADPVSK